MLLSTKLKEARHLAGLTQAQLADRSGVSIQSIKKYETDATDNITIKTIQKIADALKVSTDFFMPETVSQMSPNGKNSSPKGSLMSPNPSNLKSQNDTVLIPILHHINASAGSGAINELPKEIEHRGFTKEILRESFGVVGDYQNLFIIHSFGNSMHPTIPQNALLLVQKGIPLEGQICVARIGAEMFVKRIAKYPKIELLSDNDKYKSISITEEMDFEIIGRVVGYFGRL